MLGSLLRQLVSGLGAIPAGIKTAEISEPEEGDWWAETATSGYCEDALMSHLCNAHSSVLTLLTNVFHIIDASPSSIEYRGHSHYAWSSYKL